MIDPQSIFQQYDALLPPKYDGGFLVVSIYHKIENKELEPQFTVSDIRLILQEISAQFKEPIAQSDRIIKNLLDYHIRNVRNQPGKYELTDHARKLVKLLIKKLNNPFKSFPLKQSFDKYFHLKLTDIKNIVDLQQRYDRDFVEQHKEIINDHLEGLQEELDQAHIRLTEILRSDELNAVDMVSRFLETFKKFSERSDDISNSLVSKDHFLKTLKLVTDQFHQKITVIKQPESAEELAAFQQMENDWKIAAAIYKDLARFFLEVDETIKRIRYQIFFASEKLTELQENFAAKSKFRINLKRMLETALQMSYTHREELFVKKFFPLKSIPQEKTQILYPFLYDYSPPVSNQVIEFIPDKDYETSQRTLIEIDLKKQEKIDHWIKDCLQQLDQKRSLNFNQVFTQILQTENDLSIAIETGFSLVEQIGRDEQYTLTIDKKLTPITKSDISLWKMNITKKS